MAELRDVTQKLAENNAQNMIGHQYTANEISKLNDRFDKFFRFLKEQGGDKLEDRREAKSSTAAATSASSRRGGGSGSSGLSAFPILPLGGLGGVITGLGTALVALSASLLGLDDDLRALKIADVALSVGKGITRFGKGVVSVIDEIVKTVATLGKFVIDLSKAVIIPDETKALIKSLPERLKTDILTLFDDSELLKPFRTALSNFKIGFDRVGTKATGIVDDILKVEDFSSISGKLGAMIGSVTKVFTGVEEGGGIFGFFTKISDGFSEIIKFFPRIDFSKLLSAFGSFEGGTGLLGFFGKIFGFLEPLLSPIKKLIGLALRPAFQLFLSVFDFLYGFYEGFKSEEGSLLDRLGAGLEGGIKGVIKGFTEAIDLILVEFPAWILKQLGFDGVAENLKKYKLTDLVDPIYDAIKFFFTNIFTNPGKALQPIADMLSGIPLDFMKMILKAVLPSPDIFTIETPSFSIPGLGEFGGGTYNLNPIPDDVYRFAGINPATGESMIARGAGGMTAAQLQDYAASMSQYRPATAGNVVVGDTNQVSVSSESVIAPLAGSTDSGNTANKNRK